MSKIIVMFTIRKTEKLNVVVSEQVKTNKKGYSSKLEEKVVKLRIRYH